MTMIGETGRQMANIEASEGGAGNISVWVRWLVEPGDLFPLTEQIQLPIPVPELAGSTLLVTGSGRRLREILDEPGANLAFLVINPGGESATLRTSARRRFERVTNEFNSHLAVHHDQVKRTGTNFHAIVHAQPIHITFLSNIPRYQSSVYLNSHLLRWQPETILNMPQGIGVLPFKIPGSVELMISNLESMRDHNLVLWLKHGLMARSDVSVKRAADKIEYAEAAAKYETLNLSLGEIGEGLLPHEIRAICDTYHIEQKIF